MTLVSFLRGARVIPLGTIPAVDTQSRQRINVVGFARAENPVWKDRVLSYDTILCNGYVMNDSGYQIVVNLPDDSLGLQVVLLEHPQTTRQEWRVLTLPSMGEVADFCPRMPVVVGEGDALAKSVEKKGVG